MLKLKSQTKVWFDTKLNLSSSISDQSTAMHLDRQTALILYGLKLLSQTKSLYVIAP